MLVLASALTAIAITWSLLLWGAKLAFDTTRGFGPAWLCFFWIITLTAWLARYLA